MTQPHETSVIDIWKININRHLSKERYYYSLLQEAEKERAARFVTPQLTCRYIIVQGILRSILADYLSIHPSEVMYCYGPYKKPFLVNNSKRLQFNLSHSNDLALVAVSLCDEVGVDIQWIDHTILEKHLEANVFSKREMKLFEAMPLEQRSIGFFAAWTHKEALVKLAGVGLYQEFRDIDVPLHLLQDPTPVDFGYLQSFYITKDYLGAVASKKNFSIFFHEF